MISIRTKKQKEAVDITDSIAEYLASQGEKNGLCHLFLLHTTAALTIAELEKGETDLDLLDALSGMVPNLPYRHSPDRSHVSSHILSSLVGQSLTIPFKTGKLVLGTWQRIILVELNGPRERKVVVSVVGMSI